MIDIAGRIRPVDLDRPAQVVQAPKSADVSRSVKDEPRELSPANAKLQSQWEGPTRKIRDESEEQMQADRLRDANAHQESEPEDLDRREQEQQARKARPAKSYECIDKINKLLSSGLGSRRRRRKMPAEDEDEDKEGKAAKSKSKSKSKKNNKKD